MPREDLKSLSASEICRKIYFLRSELRARGWTDDEVNRQVAVEVTDFDVIEELTRFSEELKERDLFE